MITVTERAASALEAFLAQSDAQPGEGVKSLTACAVVHQRQRQTAANRNRR